jgi:hypothetical protein
VFVLACGGDFDGVSAGFESREKTQVILRSR